jgi:hypothetical protein
MKILRRLLPSQDVDALLGDITEEARQRSRLWYWSQLLAVVAVASWTDIRRHPLLALRAIAVGIATLVVAFAPASAMLRVVRVLSEGGYYLGPYWLTLPPNAFRWFPGLVNTLGFAASGWTIARFHRSHGIAMLMPFALLACVFPAIVLVNLATYRGPWIVLTAPRIGGMISSLSLPALVVVGGVLGLGRHNGPSIMEAYVSGVVALVIGAWRLRRRRVTPGAAAAASMHELLNDDRRAAIEIILEERAAARDPEDRDGNLPDLTRPRPL